ncbi:sulfatase-like hydrolase/transferase [Bradyrhizobium sp.]|uniref:sulfatase-like hydrolase/transferase n=1 Tax=Bradyrhizobium sp. TaxID=376 RepID=UPI0016522D07|nr:sulfatase-like hydrolase/transferase [Bradyrhizobium sp.]
MLSNTLLAWFPVQVTMVMLPLNIYAHNRNEFAHNITAIVPFLATAILLFPLLLAVTAVGKRFAPLVSHTLLFIGLFVLISDVLAPPRLGLMDGRETSQTSAILSLIQLLLFAIFVVLWWRLPINLTRAFAVPAILAILLQQALQLAYEFKISPPPPVDRVVPKLARTDLNRPNVYQVVLDGYSSLMFQRAAAESGFSGQLNGFTFFQNNIANYTVTDASVPSFLTGRLFKGGSFKEFQAEAKSGGLRLELQKAGYEISVYSPDKSRPWSYDGASHIYTSADIASSNWPQIFLIVLARATPEILRHKVYRIANRFLGYRYYRRLSIPLMQKFLSEEGNRGDEGQYVYIHLMVPHEPFVWDPQCRSTHQSSYGAQIACATKLMSSFVTRLKELNRYANSMIIIQSDHGWENQIDAQDIFRTPSNEVRKKVESSDRYFDAKGVFLRVHSLLLIKPPNSEPTPLRISSEITQLADIPATVRSLLKLQPQPGDGHSVFDLIGTDEREISVFTGFYNRNAKGQIMVLGGNVDRATLAHIGYRESRGWTILSDVEATHEGW